MTVEKLIELFDELLNVVKDNTTEQRLIDKVNSVQSHINSMTYLEDAEAVKDFEKIIKNYYL